VTMPRGAPCARLEVAVVAPDGSAVTGEELALYVAPRGVAEAVARRQRPDARGVLTVVLPSTAAGELEIARPNGDGMLLWPEVAGVARPFATIAGEVPVDPVLAVRPFAALAPGEVRRLEPVVVAPLCELLRGRVVDAAGAPIANVEVRLASAGPPAAPELSRCRVRTAADGTFTGRANALPAQWLVSGRREGSHWCDPLRVRPGDGEPVELVLQPTGAIELSLPLPEALRRVSFDA